MFNTKTITDHKAQILDADERRVKACVAVFGNVDYDNDTIIPEAVTKTIKERGPKGKNLIYNLIDHHASMKSMVGKPDELYVQGDQLISVTPIIATTLGSDYLKMCQAGLVNQFSIGFSTIKSTEQKGVRVIQELKLFEYSAVLWGANEATNFQGIVKSEFTPTKENIISRLDLLTKAFKDGEFTDDTFSLIEIEITQLKSIVEKFTQPAPKAVEPNKDQSLIDSLKLLNSKF